MNNVVLVAPTVEPITLAEAKAQLNIDTLFTDDDTFLGTLIKAARVWVEGRTSQCYLLQKREQYLDAFPCGASIELTRGPVMLTGTGVSAPVVKYYDNNDTEQTLADTTYWFDNKSFQPRIVAKSTWPSIGLRPSPISITYFAGFGETSPTVPETVRTVCKLLISNMYNNRTPEVESIKDFARMEYGIERMLAFDTRLVHAAGY